MDGCFYHFTPAFLIGSDINVSKVPSLHGHYPTSLLLRTWPSPSRLPSTSRLCRLYDTLLHRFLDGARTASPVAQHVLVTVLSQTTPPECRAVSVSLRRVMLPSLDNRKLGLQG